MRITRLTIRAAALAAVVLGGAGPLAASAEPSFVPLIRDNFPDAFVLQDKGRFYAYSTNNGANLPVAMSTNLRDWAILADPKDPKKRYDAMPALGPWAKEGFTWAPEVMELGGKYLLYYTASGRREDAQCIGVAVADTPVGPFVDRSSEPMLCQTKLGGTIDASPFRDANGKLYLYFKNDGNRVHARTWLWGQPLSADGRTVTGQAVKMMDDKARWKEAVVEAPTMVRAPTGYTLFYSGGFFGWNENEGGLSPYAMGYAACSGPLGPCTEAPGSPILHSFKDREAGCLSGPGHQSVFTVGARTFLSFHAWAATPRCTKLEDERYFYIAPLFWKDGKPTLGPSLRAKPQSERG